MMEILQQQRKTDSVFFIWLSKFICEKKKLEYNKFLILYKYKNYRFQILFAVYKFVCKRFKKKKEKRRKKKKYINCKKMAQELCKAQIMQLNFFIF